LVVVVVAVCKPAGSIIIIAIILGTVALLFLLLSVSSGFCFTFRVPDV
jgi:hypothetical protein